MYKVFVKHKNYKRAYPIGIMTDSYERGFELAIKMVHSWESKNGIYEWVKIKDTDSNKYIATFNIG